MEQSESECLACLEAQLHADALAETPPWASDAVAHAPQCGDAAAQWLLSRVTGANGQSFLAIEALRIHFPNVWASIPADDRAAAYTRQLAVSHWFNVWGQPGQPPSEAGQALMSIGPSAIPFLAPLLDSQRLAPSYGSEEATMSQLLAYRVCDYAWDFISHIEGQHETFPEKPEERDPAIQEMKERLRKQK